MSLPNSTFQVGVVLDLDSLVGRIGLSCLTMSRSDFYSVHSNYTTRLVLNVMDSKGQIIDAAASALTLLKDVEVDAIIGPQKSGHTNFLVGLGDRAHVPIISFSATSPFPPQTPYFVQTALRDDAQVGAIASLVRDFGWSQIVIIYEDSDYGNGIVPYLSNAFQDVNVRVSYRSIIPVSATDEFLLQELYKMKTMQTRVFVVHISSSIASKLFPKAKEAGMMNEGYAWIVTSGLMDLLYSMDSHVVDTMQGVLGVKPLIPRPRKLRSFANRWKQKFLKDNPSIFQAELSLLGLWAYDTLWALAMAAERVKFREPNSLQNTGAINSFNLFTPAMSQTGPKLLKELSEITFQGLSGTFSLVNRKVEPSSFQILNVVGSGERELGIWTPSRGILSKGNINVTNSSKKSLRGIIWPGESTVVPRGWEVPVSGKKLQIGVPAESGFTEYLKVERDPQTKASKVSGYYIDLFDSVMKALPFAVTYVYVPFEKPDGSSAGSYDDLAYQVFLQKYDAVVGDITITANRSKYVDFTLPFADGGVNSIVPITYDDPNDNWIFLKPLTKELWVTAIALFVLTGVALWILEHRFNNAFRGPPSQHAGLIFYFPFMSLVFAQRERIMSNLARLVVVVWMFVVLILSSTYTASLSARLTVQRLQPAVTDVNELIKNEDYVGCRNGSFVIHLLKDLGFKESNIRSCNHPEDCDEALAKGSKNGGISALFSVMPYAKLFLAKYCDKYTTVGPTHRSEGYAYVFPKGSPLVAHVSRAILELTENGRISELERQWFKNPTCKADDTITSTSVSLKSFKTLFGITCSITTSCLIVFLITYLYKNRDFIRRISNSSITIWSKARAISRHFEQRDPKFCGSKENASSTFPGNLGPSVIVPVSLEEMSDAAGDISPNSQQTDAANPSTV
ncbi:Glutamate receptor 2.2 [Abeliophyllum distichum]|uniref:Glutamate receptor n=1 Tax=Abeliophyllum distichum TaxID=126358 RepID=A0ABD1VP04_9LAMI